MTSSTANPFLAWTNLALKTGEMLFASAQVISHRTNRMLLAGWTPNERDRREFTLMGQEKLEAAAESAQAIGWRMLDFGQQAGMLAFRQWMTLARSWMSMAFNPAIAHSGKHQAKLVSDMLAHSNAATAQLGGAVARAAQTGLKPIHSRATANARRLGRIKQ